MPPFALPRLPAPTASRLTVYALSSALGAALVVLDAAGTKTTGFAVGVGLSKSNGALMVLGNLAVCVSLLAGIALQRLFFGQLRPIELEHLYDRTWYFLTESALAFTMFREDFGLPFFALFGALLGLKCFHWIAADRIDHLDQLASPPRWTFHLRLFSLLALFLLPLDLLLLTFSAGHLLTHGLTGRVIFVSEFAVLTVALGGIGARYAIWAWDQWRLAQGRSARAAERARRRATVAAALAEGNGDEEPMPAVDEEEDEDDDEAAEEDVWEGKSMVLFYLDLTTDFLKLVIYLVFFIVVLIHAGLPFNILRDLYLTTRSFLGRLRSLIHYRQATADMESRYADASADEMAQQGVCIICRDELRPTDVEGGRRAKRLGCGHAFHLRCLRMWLERQQSCPTCRRSVLGNGAPNAAPVIAQQAAPTPAAAAAGPGLTPDHLAGGNPAAPAPTAAAPAGPDRRPLPAHLVRFGDHLAQHPPEPLHPGGGGVLPAREGPAPTPTAGFAPAPETAAGGVGAGGLFGAPHPPERFAHLFPPLAAPPQPPATAHAPVTAAAAALAAAGPALAVAPVPRRAGIGFELNAFGLELDLRFFFGAPPPPPPPPPPPSFPPVAVAVVEPPTPRPAAAAPPPLYDPATRPVTPPAASVELVAPEPESDRTRLLRELSEAMTAETSASFTRVLTKIVQDAQRTEIGEELARARRFDIREALGLIAGTLHDRPEQIDPTAALFPLVLGEDVDLSLADPANEDGPSRLTLVDADGTWVLDLSRRNALWLGPDDARLLAVVKGGPPADEEEAVTATEPPIPVEDGAILDETTMTPREVAARAALRRSARLNPTPPPTTAAPLPEPTPTAAPLPPLPPPVPSPVVELEDGSVFFAIPAPPAARMPSSSSPAAGVSTIDDAAPPPLTTAHGRPLVTLTPLPPPTASSSLLPLPPTLTDAELASLAAETREAIELRLALLARVDGVLGSMRAELVRVQQALARPTAPVGGRRSTAGDFDAFARPGPAASGSGNQDAAAASTAGQGKGKAREPRDVPLPKDDGVDADL